MADRDNLKAGERRTATILFSDMKGFTALSERMDPEEMDALMTRVFGLFEEIIRSHGGSVEKYIGDALVAVFGVPELHEDDPSRAIHAALEFLARIREENACLVGRDLCLSFRTGIHTGLVTTGRRGEFDVVTGHAMSVAQRLESAAPLDAILVSESAKEKAEEDFEFGPAQDIEAKGKTEPIRAFAVRSETTSRLRDRGPFVGRREALDELLKAYIRNRYDEVSGFYVQGEAGIGKTRLVQALVEKIRLFPDFKTPVLAARAQKYRPGGFAVITDIVLGYLGLKPGAKPEEARKALLSLPGAGPEAAERFASLLSATEPDKPDPNAIAALYGIFGAILDRHSGDLFPILVVIDNAAFMDRLSREFFQYLFKKGSVKPFFVLTGREFPPELRKAFQGLKPLKLGPLAPEESEALVKAHWPEAGEEALARILEASLGNPLFLREYAAYAAKHKDVSSLPATVQNIFLASLERYPPEWRDLAKRLSVFVHSFTEDDARSLERATEGDPSIVAPALARFVQDGLLSTQREYYLFRVDVFKKALYASLLNHNKRILHALVADILLAQDKPHRIRLIYHLVRSERYAEAVKAMQEDPNRNYSYEYLPYIDILYRRLRKDDKAGVRLLITKAALLFNGGKIEESEEVLKRILRIAVAKKDDNLMGYAYHQICAYNAMSYSFQKAIFTGQKALYYYRRSDIHARSVQNVLRTMVLAQAQRGDIEEARRLVAQCEGVPGGDRFEAAEARAEFHLLSCDYDKALAVVEKSLAVMPEDRSASLFFAYDLKIKILWQLCDFQGLKEAARRLLALGPLSESALSQANAMLGLASLYYGEREAAADRFVQAEFYSGQIRNDFERLDALRTLALCRYLAGEPKKADETALEALTIGLRHSCYGPTFTLLTLLVESSMERGREERARFFLAEASYLFTTGLLLPSKDLVVYYYYAAKLLSPRDAERHMAVAFRLFEEEKARIGDPELVANFLSIRSYGRIQRELEGLGEVPSTLLKPERLKRADLAAAEAELDGACYDDEEAEVAEAAGASGASDAAASDASAIISGAGAAADGTSAEAGPAGTVPSAEAEAEAGAARGAKA
ncbi:MAG TPA: adenylate/guanylate cyclase domain-containing protein [Spirochaetales bacterium]|nr:adenylate/guanylate cyclase domain-containing protein [Spirochaetales bacterium]